ncbi:MAG TPA: IS91 family transposase [Casimicrobiaceae bacterium]
MTRPPFEVADIVRRHGDRFLETHRVWLTSRHRRVLRALVQCRTAALGGHRDRCEQCAQPAFSYNSCRDRHCPKCLTAARDQWVAAREQELLPVGYVHVVFTMPEPLARLALPNKRVVYDLLFRAAAATLLQVAANPKRLGAAIGGLMVLHTWGQRLQHHPHVHCVVPAGGLSPDGARWVHARPTFFLPIKVLRQVFRGKLVASLRAAFHQGRLSFPGALQPLATEAAFRAWLRSLFRQTWVVYAKPPFGSPAHLLHYLARYTHRVAISNHRLVAVTDETVSFRWKDYRHGSQIRTLTLAADEFLRRFLRHVLPKGFVRIRYFGFLASRCRTHDLAHCRQTLAVQSAPLSVETPTVSARARTWPCPRCGGPMRIIERLTARQLFVEVLLNGCFDDTS